MPLWRRQGAASSILAHAQVTEAVVDAGDEPVATNAVVMFTVAAGEVVHVEARAQFLNDFGGQTYTVGLHLLDGDDEVTGEEGFAAQDIPLAGGVTAQSWMQVFAEEWIDTPGPYTRTLAISNGNRAELGGLTVGADNTHGLATLDPDTIAFGSVKVIR